MEIIRLLRENHLKKNGNSVRFSIKRLSFILNHENIYSLIHETCDAFLKTNFSVELKLTEVPKTYTNFLHVHALNESEDPIWEDHGERIPAMVRDTHFEIKISNFPIKLVF